MKVQINKVSKKLKDLREKRNLTQEELAKNLGVSRQSIIALERGRCLPSLSLAISFSEIFDMPFERIFCEEIENIGKEGNHIMAQDLTPWPPIREITSLHNTIDRLFEENLSNAKPITMPLVNVLEKGKNIIIYADLPGIEEENISIEVGDEMVTISGERKTEKEESKEDYYRKEVNYGSFSRTIPLPSIVNKEKAEAEMKGGTLKITLLKVEKTKLKVTKLKVKKD